MRRPKWLAADPIPLSHYTKVIGNISHYEMMTSGDDRLRLGLIAGGIADFIRRQRWRDKAQRTV